MNQNNGNPGSGGNTAFLQTIMSMGMMMRGGNSTTTNWDWMLAALLPYGMSAATTAGQQLHDMAMEWWQHQFRSGKQHFRSIVDAVEKNSYGETVGEEDSQNGVLITAILHYLHAHQCVEHLKDADLDLKPLDGRNADLGGGERDPYYYNDMDDGNDQDNTLSSALSKYTCIKKPPVNQWHNIGVYGKQDPAMVQLQILREADKSRDKNGTTTTSHNKTTFQLQSDSGYAIDAFIEQAFSWYKEELRKQEDNSRYLYELKVSENGPSSNASRRGTSQVFKRYKLSDEKTFDSLFFPEKESLLKLLKNFMGRSGKYAIAGYPHKLGILMHGEPGTGKTSLIKTLAHLTGRSIVNVPLSKISTNSELMSIFFDECKYCEGQSVPVKLGLKNVIYVMEDVDAASKIVKRRDPKRARLDEGWNRDTFNMPLPEPLWHLFLRSTDESCKALVKKLLEKSERLRKEATESSVLHAVVETMNTIPALNVPLDGIGSAAMEEATEEYLQALNKVMDKRSKLDRFLSDQSRVLLALIENGTEIDEVFEEALLGRQLRLPMLRSSPTVSVPTPDSSECEKFPSVASTTDDGHEELEFRSKKRNLDEIDSERRRPGYMDEASQR